MGESGFEQMNGCVNREWTRIHANETQNNGVMND